MNFDSHHLWIERYIRARSKNGTKHFFCRVLLRNLNTAACSGFKNQDSLTPWGMIFLLFSRVENGGVSGKREKRRRRRYRRLPWWIKLFQCSDIRWGGVFWCVLLGDIRRSCRNEASRTNNSFVCKHSRKLSIEELLLMNCEKLSYTFLINLVRNSLIEYCTW